MTNTRRPRPAAPRSARLAAVAALALTGLLAVSACSGDPKPARQAGGAAITAEPAALSPTAGSGSPGTTGTSTSPGGSPSGGVVALTPDVQNRLDAAIKQVMDQASIPGVIVGYTTPDGSYLRSFGVADKSAGTPMSADLYSRIGSITKTYVATAVLLLADQGKLSLDDPITKYVPNVPGGDGITLRQLGDMRSGLYDYTRDPNFQQALTADPGQSFTPDHLLSYSYRHQADFPPDSRFEYSNTNYVLLGQVVEKVSGQPLGDFLKAQVFGPAGLTRTVFPTDATFPDPHAHGYTDQSRNGGLTDATTWNPSWGWAAGAAVSDLADLQSWAKTLATGAPLLNSATQADRLKARDTGSPDVDYGFGVFDSHGWIGHNGSLPGYQAVAVYLPSAQASLAILLNSDVPYRGTEPSTLLAQAITRIVSPDNVYAVPSGSAMGSPTASGSPSGTSSGTASGSPSGTSSGTTSGSPTGSPTGTSTGTSTGSPTGTSTGSPTGSPTATGSPTLNLS